MSKRNSEFLGLTLRDNEEFISTEEDAENFEKIDEEAKRLAGGIFCTAKTASEQAAGGQSTVHKITRPEKKSPFLVFRPGADFNAADTVKIDGAQVSVKAIGSGKSGFDGVWKKDVTTIGFYDESGAVFYILAAKDIIDLSAENTTSGTLPVSKGGTGAMTAQDALTNLGITVAASVINYLEGLKSNAQQQIDGKAPKTHSHTAENITSGTIPVERGGTGATTAKQARANLDAASASEMNDYAHAVSKRFEANADSMIQLSNQVNQQRVLIKELDTYAKKIDASISGRFVRETHTLCTGKTIEAGQNLSLSITLSKDGYIPIGIVGQHHDGSYATFAMIQNLYLDSVASGRGTVNCIVKNIHSSATIGKTGDLYSLSVDILWVKA